ncbi:hypothetical protein [Ascidiimonas sp. W6]|uniref:hypothetical protein n=1 Tax=Ascidiimonas meishanensis TaxID=3128903 RepID=UPI0030EF8702
MKRIQLLTTILLLTGMVTFANHVSTNVLTTKDGFTKRYRNAQPIKFVERGIKFFIFPNGEFEYRLIRPVYTRRGSSSVILRTPGRIANKVNRPYRKAPIRFDRNGRVKRIRNVSINYDQFGRVFRVGSVYMNYGRRGVLNQVGGLDVRFTRNGRLIHRYGAVHSNNNYTYTYRRNRY